ncbi:hypothetical protein ACHHYP_05480 [Achlya hypogyna]|uniref:Uncharacterized protein n=1 Tax=Achlya hypogyna TaxID=1202772 RepID=A0A1V9YXJ7_ACHHY|nr:hypothetical protein ACHHYP_05480 [Achlya hypogyna]
MMRQIATGVGDASVLHLYADAVENFMMPKKWSTTGTLSAKEEASAAARGVRAWDLGRLRRTQGTTTTVVPPAAIPFDMEPWNAFVAAKFGPRIKTSMTPDGPFQIQLAHLAVDHAGDVATVAPPPPAGAFGTLVMFLPSAYSGGRVVAHEGVDTKQLFTLRNPAPDKFSFIAAYASATWSVSPITEGSRTLLVYHFVYASPAVHTRAWPTTRDDAMALLREAAAAVHAEDASMLSYRLRNPPKTLDWSLLTLLDLTFVEALATTGAYDMALVKFKNLDELEEWDPEVVDALPPHSEIIDTCVCYASCNVPQPAQNSLPGCIVQTFVNYHSFEYSDPDSMSLVFWPKSFRNVLIGLHPLLTAIENAMGGSEAPEDTTSENAPRRGSRRSSSHPPSVASSTKDRFFGYSSVREMVVAAMQLHEGSFELLRHRGGSDDTYEVLQGVSYFKRTTDILDALQDRSLVCMFIDKYIRVRDDVHVYKMAPWLRRVLAKYGWEAVEKPFLGMLRRWVTSWQSISEALDWVCALAGRAIPNPSIEYLIGLLDPNPRRLRLQQPFALEFIKRCATIVLDGLYLLFAATHHPPYDADIVSTVFLRGLLLEAHFRCAPQAGTGVWLAGRLPAPVLALVDAYLGPAHAMHEVAAAFSVLLPPLHVLAPAVVEAVGLDPAVRFEPFFERIHAAVVGDTMLPALGNDDDAVDDDTGHLFWPGDVEVRHRDLGYVAPVARINIITCVKTIASLLTLAETAKWPLASIERIWAKGPLRPATVSYFSPIVMASLEVFDDDLDVVFDLDMYYACNQRPDVVLGRRDMHLNAQWHLVADAIEFFVRFDAPRVIDFVHAWLEIMAGYDEALNIFRTVGFGILTHQDNLPPAAALALATACLSALQQAERPVETPAYVSVGCTCPMAKQINYFLSVPRFQSGTITVQQRMCPEVEGVAPP